MTNPSKNFEMIRLYPRLGADPDTGKVGEIYYNTSINALKLCVDSAPTWTVIGQSSLPFQDKNFLLIEGGIWSNTEDLSGSILSHSEDAYIQVPGLPREANQIEPSSFSMVDGDVIYVDLNRTATPTVLAPVKTNISAVSFSPDRIILAACVGTAIIVGDRLSLALGDSGYLDSAIRGYDSQNFNLQLVGDGKISYAGLNLTFENDVFIHVSGLPLSANKIEASSYLLNTNEILYAIINRTSSDQTLLVFNEPIGTKLPLDAFILATNLNSEIFLCSGDKLTAGQTKVLGEAVSVEVLASLGLADWKDKYGQLRILSAEALGEAELNCTWITPANKTAIDDTFRSLSTKNKQINFPGAKINWSSGKIYDFTGTNLIGQMAALPVATIVAGQSRWYSISLKPNLVNSDNEITFDLIITPAASDSTTLKADYADNSLQLGQVLIKSLGEEVPAPILAYNGTAAIESQLIFTSAGLIAAYDFVTATPISVYSISYSMRRTSGSGGTVSLVIAESSGGIPGAQIAVSNAILSDSIGLSDSPVQFQFQDIVALPPGSYFYYLQVVGATEFATTTYSENPTVSYTVSSDSGASWTMPLPKNSPNITVEGVLGALNFVDDIFQSDIIQNSLGASSGGADTLLSNLTAPTAINQDLLPDNTGVRNIGSLLKKFQTIFSNILNLNGLEYAGLSSTLTINDNQNSWIPIITLDKTTYPFVIVEYSMVKSGAYRVGRFLLTNDGTAVGFSDDYTETVFSGVNFDAIVSGPNVEIVYTSTQTGASGNFKFSIRKWS